MMHRRGSVIIESALTLTVILFVLYGTLQLGVVGLEQLTVDGGAFTMAHQQSFQGGSKTYTPAWDLATATLSHLGGPNYAHTTQSGEPPTTLFAGQYGFNTPNARYGGVSMVQPVQTIATITKSRISNIVLGFVGATLSVTGTAIEPQYRLINGHADVSGNNFNSTGAFATAADPLSESAPPYLVGFNYLQLCPYQIAGNATPNWTNCPNSSFVTAIGSAEYLDAHNWSRPQNGVTPSGRAVFWETRYHQTLFAKIAANLTSPAIANGNQQIDLTNKAQYLNPLGTSEVGCVYSFDNNNVGAYSAGNTGVGDPLFALHPDYTSATCQAP